MARSGWWRIAPVVALALALVAPAATRAADVSGVTLHLPALGGFTVSGTVHDSHGNPVAGAYVGTCEVPDSCFDVGAPSAVDGSFTVRGAAAGTWFVVALPPEDTNLVPAYLGAGGASVSDIATAVAIEIGANVTGLALVLDDGLHIMGKVVDTEGGPVVGATVYPNGGPSSGSPGVSGPDGTYAVSGLVAGVEYRLHVSAPEGSHLLGGYVQEGTAQQEYPSTTYTPGPADVAGADITLVRGRSISGQLGGLNGAAVDVAAIGDSGSASIAVAPDGAFSVFPLWPGPYRLHFSVHETGLEGQFPYGLYNGDGQVLVSQYEPGVTVDVTADDVAGLTANLPTLPSISGTISDAGGPLAGAHVGFCEPALGCGYTVTDGSGHYSFLNTPPGAYTIRAGALGHVLVWHGTAGPVTDDSLSTPVTMAATSLTGIDMLLPTGSSISGTVVDQAGQPIEGANVSAVGADRGIDEFGPGGATTDATGHFTIRGLKEWDYYLSASGPEGSAYAYAYWSLSGGASDIDEAVMLHVGTRDTAPRVTFKTGRQLGTARVPILVTWPSAGTSTKAYGLQSQVNGGTWTTAGTFPTASSEGTFAPSSATTHRFRVLAGYKDLTSTLWGTGPTFRVLLTQQTTSAITWRGTWKTVRTASASGGSYRVASSRGASATYTFTGRAVAWVAMRGTGFGKATVSIDGARPVTVDLRAGSTLSRRIVLARSWGTSARHTIKITCLGTAGHPRVDIDAFTVIR